MITLGVKKKMSNEITVDDNSLLNDLNEEIKNQSAMTPDLADTETKIQRVPKIMSQNKNFNESYYKPSEVSIGPIHANSGNLSKRELKIKLVAIFVKKSGKTGEELLGQIKANVNELRKCFDERVIVNYVDDDRLSQLLFLDGCFLLQFVESYLSDSLKDFEITKDKAEVISNDLFLAENQIPFLVLVLLMNSCQDKFQRTVLKFVTTNLPIGYRKFDKYPTKIVKFFGEMVRRQAHPNYNRNPYGGDWVHLLGVLRWLQIFQSWSESIHVYCQILSRKTYRGGKLYPSRSFRNVQELKLAGIKLRPSTTFSLIDIFFSTKCFISGQLNLPAFVVDNSTAPKLLNLVAYEMCKHDYETNCTVTSFVNFLDLLIDNEQDVKDLRAAHILMNHLSSDAEVAQLINNIGYCCRTAPKDAYWEVKNDIQRHYERKISIWMAQVYNDQFKSPWTVIAFLAASIILILTAIQTWYAVYPRKN